MKFCSIVPIHDLKLTIDRPYNMLLAHLCKYPKYIKWAKKLKGYKIMDNSIIEMGEAFSLRDLLNCAFECEVDEIILPDVFNDGPANCKLAISSVEEFNKLKKEYPDKKFPKIMVVCQGKNLEEFKNSFELISSIPDIDCIGIPKITQTWCKNKSRSDFFDVYSKTNKEIHLLGCWYTLNELNSFTKDQLKRIRTIDTCLPALLSLTTNEPFIDRNLDRTIDLENDIINVENYNHIINVVDNLLE